MHAQEKSERPFRWIQLTLMCALLFLVLILVIRLPAVGAVDNRLLMILEPLRQKPWIAFFTRLTDLGSSRVLNAVIALAVIFLLIKRRLPESVILPAVFAVERFLNGVLKQWVTRERPPVPHLVHETGFSFPSGHAMNAVTVYGLLIILIVPLIQHAALRRLWILLNLTLILLIGFSRPFLGVHYVTDILAGYAAGGMLVGLTGAVLTASGRAGAHRQEG